MATSSNLQYVQVTGKMLKKLKKFLEDGGTYHKAIRPGLFPAKATASEMRAKCVFALNVLLEKYEQYKQAGVIPNDDTPLTLGHLTEKESQMKSYQIASNWMGYYNVGQVITKAKLRDFYNNWVGYNRARIGMDVFAVKYTQQRDPKTKQVKLVSSADEYFRERNFMGVKLAVVDAEQLLSELINQYTNDNDHIDIDSLDKRYKASFTLINSFTSQPTVASKTPQGLVKKVQLYQMQKQREKQLEAREAAQQQKIATEEQAVEVMKTTQELIRSKEEKIRELEADIKNKEQNKSLIEKLKAEKSEYQEIFAQAGSVFKPSTSNNPTK